MKITIRVTAVVPVIQYGSIQLEIIQEKELPNNADDYHRSDNMQELIETARTMIEYELTGMASPAAAQWLIATQPEGATK